MATPPLKIGGQRVTTPGRKKKGRKGRPPGTRKKRKFEETKLGFFLKYEAPIEYELIMSSTPPSPFPEPSIRVVEAITFASPNPVFYKDKFYRFLEDYKKNKLCIRFPKRATPEQEARYEKQQRKAVFEYIKKRKKQDNYFG